MGRPIQKTSPVVFNACTSATGFAIVSGLATLALAAIAKPVQKGSTPTPLVRGVGSLVNTNAFFDFTGSFDVNDENGIDFWIYVDMTGATTINTGVQGNVYLFDAGFANSLIATTQFCHGWNHVMLGRGDFVAGAGSAVWATTNFTVLRFKITAAAGVTHSFYLCDFAYAGYSRPQLAVMFDDAYESVIDTAYPVMAARGIVGTVAVIASKIGTSGYMTLAELQTLHEAGWALVNHSVTHGPNFPWLASATQAECLVEIEGGRDYLKNNGFTRDSEHLHYCSPGGEWSANYLAAAAQAGCLMFRGLFGDQAASTGTPTSIGDSGVRESMIAGVVPTNAWSAANLTGRTAQLISSGRSAVYVFHDIVTPANTTIKFLPTDFTTVMNDIYRKKAMIDTVTLPQLREALYDPTT